MVLLSYKRTKYSLVTPFRDIVQEMKEDLEPMVTKIESEIQSQDNVKSYTSAHITVCKKIRQHFLLVLND